MRSRSPPPLTAFSYEGGAAASSASAVSFMAPVDSVSAALLLLALPLDAEAAMGAEAVL